ncbi:MAG: hypothetical protein V4642_16350, partial [Bacteroidota bacterium]
NEKIIGTFRFNIASLRSYTLFVFKKNGQPEILLLDELNGAATALKSVDRVLENTVLIRTVNFSQRGVDISNQTDKIIASGLQPNSIGKYESLITCNGTGADSLSIFSTGAHNRSGSIITSLEVLKQYSIIVLDSGAENANYSILVPPVRNSFKTPGMASIRVVNATTLFKNITVSLGAQNDSSASGFRSGGTLASALLKGTTSEMIEITAGNIPLAIFTSSLPPQLLLASPANIQAGEEYLLIVQNSADGEVRASLLKSSAESQAVEFLQKGSFIQIVHAVPGLEKIPVSVGNSLSGAMLYYRGSLATVVPSGAVNITAGNVLKTITISPDSSLLVIIAGTDAAPEILTFLKPNRALAPGTLERRFINASKEITNVSALANDTTEFAEHLADDLAYGEASDFQVVTTERRLSVIFRNLLLKETYFRTENINFPIGKRYSLIFAGAKDKGGYSVITQQEF